MLSVIIPVFNNGQELIRAVSSVLAQKEISSGSLAVEIIMVNDASDPQCVALLEQIAANTPEVKLLHHSENKGPSNARNTGIKQATGELISFIDGDDEWPEDKLALLLPHLAQPEIKVVSGRIKYIFLGDVPRDIINFQNDEDMISHVHLGATLVRRSVFDEGMYFPESLRYSEDMDWWLQLRENQIGIVIVEEPTLLYYIHGNNMTFEKTPRELNLFEMLRISLRRRRSGKAKQALPQLNDFRLFQRPCVSVIMPLYNGEAFFCRALASVFQQSYPPGEVIVVDDGSTDRGVELITHQYPQVRIIKQSNLGPAAARNTALREAKGKYIAFLDADDEWLPGKLAQQVASLNSNPYVAFVTCNQLHVTHSGNELPADITQNLAAPHRALTASGLMVRKHAIDCVGGYNAALRSGEDMDLLLRLRQEGYQELNVEQLLLKTCLHSDNHD